ncbi:hypothetical protein [Virgibacillus sp. YIM 98842]|uniref:hypothetical protein n=1 Tax=Virgibacillus sp. YIM 98842 TaxID=2663533 RepID=UPI0013D8E985|nr:hypothetical protein [Virgibacillus sp. YIM 98842]
MLGQKDISEMDPAELPDVFALQDDFTREFISSLDEVESGYYLFESKTGGYTMMYPENAKLDEIYYEMPGDYLEAIQFGEGEETSDHHYGVRATYNEGDSVSEFKRLQGVFEARTSYDGDYETIEYDDKKIYFATSEYEDQNGDIITYNFLGIIMSNNSDQSVSMNYMTDKDSVADMNSDVIKEKVIKIMESIKFK